MRRSERRSSTRANKGSNLLAEIEAGAHDPKADLPTLLRKWLRKCITLGGATGSTRLRDLATKELKGYEADDSLPSYRITRSLLFLDAAVVGGRITNQQAPLPLIPDIARPSVQGDIHLPQPTAEIVDLVSSARRDHEGSVRLSPPPGSRTPCADEPRAGETRTAAVGRGTWTPAEPGHRASTGW